MKNLLPVVLCCLLSFFANAQVIGDFTLPDVRNDNPVSLSDYSNRRAVIVIFTSTQCPYDTYYTDRMKAMVNDYQNKGVQIVLINSSPGESPEQLKDHSGNFDIPYLDDRQQVVMRLLDARKSPEAFILVPVNGGFRKMYQGALDNNPQVASDVKKAYLRQNLEDILAGNPLTYADVLPVGCRIRTP